MKKRILVVAIITMMMMLVGCVDADITIDLEKNGSGNVTVEVKGPESIIGSTEEADLDELRKQYDSVELIDENGTTGYKISSKINNLSELASKMPFLSDKTEQENREYIVLNEEKGLFSNEYYVNIKLKDILLEDMSSEDLALLSYTGSSANITLNLKTPNEVEISNASTHTEENGKNVYGWEYTLSDLNNANFTIKKTNTINVIIAVALLVLILVGIFRFVIKNKRNTM